MSGYKHKRHTITITPKSVIDRRKDRRQTVIALSAFIIGIGVIAWGIWTFMRSEGVW